MQIPTSEAAKLHPDNEPSTPAYGQHIVSTSSVRSGKPRIAGRRITVADIAEWHLRQHRTISELAHVYGLTYAQIHAALAYYYDHQAEIDEREAADRVAVEALQQNYPSKLHAPSFEDG